MVRLELDTVSSNPSFAVKHHVSSGQEKNDIVMLMSNTSVKSGLRPLPPLTQNVGGIHVHRSEFPTPSLSTFIEYKTRSVRGDLDYGDIYSQLVFSQTPNLYVARHMRGNF